MTNDDILARWDEYCLRIFGAVPTIKIQEEEKKVIVEKKVQEVEKPAILSERTPDTTIPNSSHRCNWCRVLLKDCTCPKGK